MMYHVHEKLLTEHNPASYTPMLEQIDQNYLEFTFVRPEGLFEDLDS